MTTEEDRRRTVSIAAAVGFAAIIVAAIALAGGRSMTAPPPVGPASTGERTVTHLLKEALRCDYLGHPPEWHPPPKAPIVADLRGWLAGLSVGEPPLTPYWHEGVLHVRGVEIKVPYDVHIEVSGETVLVGLHTEEERGGTPRVWALVRGNRLEPLPVRTPARSFPELSVDGRIAFWTTYPTPETTRFVTWDTETNTGLASRTLPRPEDQWCRLELIGVDADGIAYWVDEESDHPINRWDVRADTVEQTHVDWEPPMTLDDQAAPLSDLAVGLEDAFVSPAGNKEIFTGPAPGDPTPECCLTQLRVRPAGPVEKVEPRDIIALPLPEGMPSMRLWDAYSDRGTWGVWWETNETVLLDAEIDGHSYLVRCRVTGDECELIFDLGRNSSMGDLYLPDWEERWVFARFPISE